MTSRKPGRPVFYVTAGILVAALAWTQDATAQDQPPGTAGTTAESQAGSEDEASQAPLPAPKYLNLRYDEDFSYLDRAEGSYHPDMFDVIKNIDLGDDWRLSLGGEFRVTIESETNKAFGATEPANDTFQHYRYFLHADVRYRNVFRVFVQGAVVHDEDRDLAFRGSDENIADLQQLFFDLRVWGGDERPVTLRVGRQELLYGNERYVSPLDWASTRRRFDAVKLFWTYPDWTVDMFYAKPVVVQRRQRDRYNEDFDFYGLYVTYTGIPRHGLDLYAFAVDNTGSPVNPNGKAGDKSTYTLGSRFWGKTGGFDYETELAGQWGHWAGDTVQAWSWATTAGYTFSELKCQPRLGLGFDWASGDDNPTDGKVGTFDQLFPLGHTYLGFMDLIGRQNITAARADLSAWIVPGSVKGAIAYHAFWLTHPEDALYNAAGGVVRRDPTGDSGRKVGQEMDLTVKWKLDAHSNVLLGYSHFWDSDLITNTGPSEDADLFYVQYQLKF
ncbi:MAG: alginate export family protein [Planctomycetes bacterium]|nr:alginate export family protein [Planctomycetota bacterium]